jgi:hypothetical protein
LRRDANLTNHGVLAVFASGGAASQRAGTALRGGGTKRLVGNKFTTLTNLCNKR